MKDNSLTVSVKEAAEILGLSKAMLFKLWRNGQGPLSIKIGRRTLVRLRDLEAWLDAIGGENHAC